MEKLFKIKGLRWWIAILLMGITTINYLDRLTLSVAAPTLKENLAISEIHYSRIVMAFQFAYLVMMPFAGRIIDWLGLRLGFTLSIITWSIAQMATGLATGWRSFALFRCFLGGTEAGNFPGGAKAVAQWFRPKERTMATGIFNVGAGLGALIAPPMVAFLILTYNWKVAFLVTGFIGFIWAILWAVLYRSPEKHPWLSPNELIYIQEGQQELAVETAPSMTEEPGRGLRILQVMLPAFIYRLLRPFLDILLQRKFMALGIARFFSEPAWQFFSYWIPLYLATERGMNLKQIGYFAWLPFLAADLGSLFGGALSPFFMRFKVSVMTARKCSATVSALLMVFAVFVGRVQSVEWAIFFICIASFAHQSMSATLMTLPADLFPESSVATANGLSGTVAVAGGMIFTGIVGVVAQTIGYGPLFTTIAFLDIVGVAFLWALLHQPKAVAKAV